MLFKRLCILSPLCSTNIYGVSIMSQALDLPLGCRKKQGTPSALRAHGFKNRHMI